ncbi:LAME_0C01992g1_1 [Lachancea meyersii CBS 8951]|uniref:LAME_0C01992g1_1 n=1 Tax=Lachancea meyersii CBS 8951 TaxID=1266667 RepID=A0A1G4IZB1_9SACH|nr:LAME_0C01992g1_1 [Lachancea meyersii CBS 8951]
MNLLLPLDKRAVDDIQKLRESHLERKFVVFDEDLRIFFQLDPNVVIETIQVYINEACVYSSAGPGESLEKHENGLQELRTSVIDDYIFQSNMVMNNGHKNQLLIKADYAIQESHEDAETQTVYSLVGSEPLLPSFEPLGTVWPTNSVDEKPSKSELHTVEIVYPIHTLLNVRLRNVTLPAKQCIFSSLDLQTSKSCQSVMSQYNLQEFKIVMKEIDYRLLHNYSSASVKPLFCVEPDLMLEMWDSYSINYALPQTKGLKSHRVRVSLRYEVLGPSFQFLIQTAWETDVTLRRQNGTLNLASQPTSVMSTPMHTPSMKFAGSMSSLVATDKLDGVSFQFLAQKPRFELGAKFSLPLQIINHSQTPLDLVVYCANTAIEPQGQFPVEKEYMLHKRWMKNTQSIVLLSNDRRLPTVPPSETLCVELDFFAILRGYFHGIPGLRVLDLVSQEVRSIGSGVKILID